MFELESTTKAKLVDVVVLSQKNRQPDDNPGAKLTLSIDLPSDSLVLFDGRLRGYLFEKTTAPQGAIEGLASEQLTGIGKRIGTMRWAHDLVGYELVVDMGLGTAQSNLTIADCQLSGWRLTPKEGGAFTAKVNVESSDVSEAAFGKLAKLKSREISITLTPPEVQQESLDQGGDAPAPGKNRRRVRGEAAAVH